MDCVLSCYLDTLNCISHLVYVLGVAVKLPQVSRWRNDLLFLLRRHLDRATQLHRKLKSQKLCQNVSYNQIANIIKS